MSLSNEEDVKRRLVMTGRGNLVLGRIEIERYGEKVTKIIRDDSGILGVGHYLKFDLDFNMFTGGPESQILWAKNAFHEPDPFPAMVRSIQLKVDIVENLVSHVVMEFMLQVDEFGRTGPTVLDPYGIMPVYSESE